MKILKYILALFFAVTFLIIPIVIGLVKFQNTLPLGKLLKTHLIRYPFLLTTINLNEPGDARYLYISPAAQAIKVNLAYAHAITSNDQAKTWIQQMINDTTGKTAEFHPNTYPIIDKDIYSQADLNIIHQSLPHSTADNPVLNIVYITSFQEQPSYAGVTLHRDTIFIFINTLHDLTPKLSELADFERSTLLHEWGHLIGMEHNDFPNCIMATETEVAIGSPFLKNKFPTTYCWNELYEISSIKSAR